MPYVIRKDSAGRSCVHKEGADGEAAGEALGCHTTRDEAFAQMRALYANEPDAQKAVKFADGSDDTLAGWGIPYGGPFNGRDLDRQFFSGKTDFALDWFTERPILYHHGLDSDAGTAVVGRVKSFERKDQGVWVQAQLDKQSAYFSAIKELVAKGALYFSSGAMAHLVKVEPKSGEIIRWPWVELSLTPTPANLLATVDYQTADKHFKAAGLTLPETCTPEPDEPPAESPAEKAVPYEMLIARLQTRVNRYDPFGAGAQSTVEATLPGWAYVSRKSGDDVTFWRVPYALAADGHPELGEAVEIHESDIPDRDVKALPETSFTVQADTVRHYALTLAQRTKDLSERRLKEGRVLSSASRASLAECVTSMRGAADQLQAFLDATDPARAKAKAEFERLMAEFEDIEFEIALSGAGG